MSALLNDSPLLAELKILEARLTELDDYDFATSSDLRAWQITRFALELELLKLKAQLAGGVGC